MRVAIIGAGITGLTAALRLSQAGHQVTIYEQDIVAGGLATGFRDTKWQWPLERHYHHIFKSDSAIQRLAHEIGTPVIFKNPITAILFQNSQYRFDGPLEIIKFPHLNLLSKFRLSATLAFLKLWPFWQTLETSTSADWIPAMMGTEAWQKIWEPLFIGKFGKYHTQVATSWFWARIHARSRELGYFQGGFQSLINNLVNKLSEQEVKIHLSTPVQSIKQSENQIIIKAKNKSHKYDQALITGPGSLLARLAPQLPTEYQQRITTFTGLGAVTLVLALNRSLLSNGTYWLNINDKLPFLAVVEHTNFIDKSYYNNDHLVYIGNYLPSNHQYFEFTESQLIRAYQAGLKKINPDFKPSWIRKAWAFKAKFAQPIITPNYSTQIPDMQTPIPRLWWCGMQHVYPWDRGTNYAVEWGERVAILISQSHNT